MLARVAGGLAVAGALVRLIVPAAPLAHGTGVAANLGRGNFWDFVVLLPLVALIGAAGGSAAMGRLPRLGLAVLLPVGTAAIGQTLRTIYLFDSARSSQDLPLGIGSSFHYRAGGGLTLLLVADLLLVLAFVAASVAWSRTVMEDEGGFDGLRAKFAAVGLIAGVVGGLAVGMAAGDASIPGAAAPPVLEQDGLAELGGLVIAVGVAAWGAFAPTLRPRLATVGVFAALAVLVGTEGLSRGLLAARSPVVGVGAGAVTELLAAVALAALAVGAWRLTAKPPAPVD
jgi:iron complex transport system permease protein